MPSVNSVTVKAPAAAAWTLIGDEFVAVDRWMAAIPRAEPLKGPALPGAPARGRNSYLIKKFDPLYQEELLTAFDADAMTLSVEVTLRNCPIVAPIKGYTSTVIVKPINDVTCEVTWIGEARPKWFSRPMRRMLTNGLDAGFIRNLEEIQHFVETGQPHPRKVEKIKSEAALAA